MGRKKKTKKWNYEILRYEHRLRKKRQADSKPNPIYVPYQSALPLCALLAKFLHFLLSIQDLSSGWTEKIRTHFLRGISSVTADRPAKYWSTQSKVPVDLERTTCLTRSVASQRHLEAYWFQDGWNPGCTCCFLRGVYQSTVTFLVLCLCFA